MRRIIAWILVLASCFGMLSVTASAASLPFTDVASDAYYAVPVAWAVEKGITTGVAESTFAPNDTCTRGQVVTFLYRAAGSPEPAETTHNFTDISEGAYYYKAVLWAVEKGITTGTSDTTFSPDGTCTRGQVVTFLYRAAGSPEPTETTHNFTDIHEGDYYYKAVLWAVENGITKGVSDTAFDPNGTCTRGQVVTFLYRYFSAEEAPETPLPDDRGETTLVLKESAATVENGGMLRANTYAVTTANGEELDVVYFPVTMYNYEQNTINAATDAKDDNLTVREGLYFTDGAPVSTRTTTADMSAFVEGDYYIQSISAANNNVAGWLQAHEDNKIYGVDKGNATAWTLSIENDQYYLSCTIDGVVYYMVVGTNGDTDGYSTTKTAVELVGFTDPNGVQIKQDNHYLNQWGGGGSREFGGWGTNNDSGNGMLFYPVDSDTPIAPGESVTKVTSGYELWNRWDKGASAGGKSYTGLVEDTLVNDQIVFNVPDGGIFNNVTDVKDIYEYVGMPFVLEKDNVTDNEVTYNDVAYYVFDSEQYGAYFAGDPQSGTVNNLHNLSFTESPRPRPTDLNVASQDAGAFLPFNNQSSFTVNQTDDHFGMRADIPFSMSANGRVNAMRDDSAPITFSFSGDDDVWVFIDGHLVIDLGGIHDRLEVTIDFAANTITYTTGSFNDPSFATTQQLFTVGSVEGVLPYTREAFADDPDHVMQFFYLERGEGASNAKIKFNLPMSDAVLITKDATQSWSSAQDDADGDNGDGTVDLSPKEQAAVDALLFGFTLYKMDGAYLDSTGNFNTDIDPTLPFYHVANTKYIVLDKDGNVIGSGSTDAYGKFYLKNGQTAKFITDFPAEGVTYLVQEDETPEGFLTPDYQYAGTAANGFSYNGEALNPAYDSENPDPNVPITVVNKGHVADAGMIAEHELPMAEEGMVSPNQSYFITAWGSTEATDTLEFICINYLDEDMPKPSAFANEDIIVLDYGLPVEIDPLANDVFRGDDVEIVAWGDGTLKLNEVLNANGFAVPDGTEGGTSWTEEIQNNFHSGTVEFHNVTYADPQSADDNTIRDTFTYTLNKQLTEVEVISYIIKVSDENDNYRYSLAKIYIVPATTMYYEENFANLVTFKDGKGEWEAPGDVSVITYQEPGVVGTVGDSTYGSDVAYLNDSGDSNGTSRHGDTTDGAIQFSYTFTGTGTSFFARTSATTGYMQIKLYEGTDTSGQYKDIVYRDTYYKDANNSNEDSDGTLYNIPVYTNEDLPYGTYTLVVTVAKAGTLRGGETGKDFYLDGIRIIQPLNLKDHITGSGENNAPVYDAITEKALGAYATDGEDNMDIVTLRYKLIADNQTGDSAWNFVVFTDTNGEVDSAAEYTSIGPKEEVYLLPGQSVSFSIKYWHQHGYMMNLGMKAPFGTAGARIGQTTFDLTNAPDCYFNITDMQTSVVSATENNQTYYIATYTITATDRILALTNLKVTGNYEFVLAKNVDIHIDGSYGEDS